MLGEFHRALRESPLRYKNHVTCDTIRFSQKGGNFLLNGTVIADYVKLTSATREKQTMSDQETRMFPKKRICLPQQSS